MAQPKVAAVRRTSADDVFDHLQSEIVSLRILPGTKMSEVEVASQFGISRQPVRDAFIRLANLGLLLIRPQKATVVRKFSMTEIARARFVRQAVEAEILRQACVIQDSSTLALIESNLKQQEQAIARANTKKFHDLDYEFHRLLCVSAHQEHVFETIAECKSQVDRLCHLSLSESNEMRTLYQDHLEIQSALIEGDVNKIVYSIHRHLGRLDSTVVAIRKDHSDYFED